MHDWIMAGIIIVAGTISFVAMARHLRRRGEDCPRYPYDCPYCFHAAECIDIICEQNRRRENAGKKKK